MTKYRAIILVISFVYSAYGQVNNVQALNAIAMEDLYPWCIVAYDSVKRAPEARIEMIKSFGFTKYAYDWRDTHLEDAYEELRLAVENDIEIVSVWLWLNANRDSYDSLSDANRRMLGIVDSLKLKTTIWLGLNGNFFEGLDQKKCIERAAKIVSEISAKANKMGCTVALYNHTGWFGNPLNQIEVIRVLPAHNLKLVYNFHHAHQSIDEFSSIAKAIVPYLAAVNLNGMKPKDAKILPLGSGEYEKGMIWEIQKQGFNGPWGILGHVADRDVKQILRENLEGLRLLQE